MTKTFKFSIYSLVILSQFIFTFGCATKSTITIPAKQEFVLGEQESKNYKIEVENISNESVQVVRQNKEGKEPIEKMMLEGKKSTVLKSAKNETLRFKNNSNTSVKVKVKLNKGVEGMRYQAIKETGRFLLKDSLVLDLNLLEQALREMHPGIYRYNTPEQIEQLFNQLKKDLPSRILENEFMTKLAQTIVKIKCGHTYLNPWNLNKEVRTRLFGGKTFFPIGFTIIDGRFYSTENATSSKTIKRGAEILAINDMQIDKIYEQLKTIAKTDGNNYSPVDHYLSLWNYQTRNWEAFDLYFQLFFPLQDEEFKVTFRNYGESVTSTISVPAMTKKERADKMTAKYGKEILEQKQWKVKVISKDLAVIKLGTFAIWNWKDFDHKQWLADAFQQLDSLQINRVAIDIRGNGGGLAEPANELMSYLINDTLKCEDIGKVFIRTTKFNPDLLPFIETWVEPLKVGLPEDMYAAGKNGLFELLLPSECTDLAPNENRFKGEIFIFGGPSNVSATYTLLNKANQFGFATFMGQESGGNRQGINGGEYAFFTMPYSKMEVDIPLKYFTPPTPSPDAGVLPKVNISYTQKDIATNRDPFIAHLKK